MSSKVAWGFNPKKARNSFNDPRFHALDCCIPRMVIAFRQFGMLFGPKAPAHNQSSASWLAIICEIQTSRIFNCTCQNLYQLVIRKLAIRVSFQICERSFLGIFWQAMLPFAKTLKKLLQRYVLCFFAEKFLI